MRSSSHIHTVRPWNEDSVFDIRFEDWEIRDNYCQIQLRATRRTGFEKLRVDWGDGTVVEYATDLLWHNYRESGKTFRVRIGGECKWWRLWDCYAVTTDGRPLVARPAIFPVCWSDWLESCSGTFCGWNNSVHGGVQGRIIPWGRSITSACCCYQFCTDVTGPFQPWTETITDATGTYDTCRNLRGPIPPWGRNITAVAQCYRSCNVYGRFPRWPDGCVSMNSCYEDVTTLKGEVPPWPVAASEMDSTYKGCTGAVGDIPPWPPNPTWLNGCYMDCINLTGAWTDDPAELMPEEKVHAPGSTYYRCYDVVTGCADSLRALFWDKNWGGTIPRPTEAPKWP